MLNIHHSAAVHIPLALAVLFPLFHLILLWLVKTDFLPRRVWLLMWALSAVQIVTSVLSYFTGQRDMAFSSGSTEMLASHQDLAGKFLMVWVALFFIFPLAFSLRRKFAVTLVHLLLIALLAVQLALAVRLGMVGGQLVFGMG